MKILVLIVCCFLETVISWAQDGSNDFSFNADKINLGDGPNREVRYATLQSDGKILIIGDFTSYDGIDRKRIARLNPDSHSSARWKDYYRGWFHVI